ncbi:ATPase, T2SS/T4P/T4SS family [Brucella sp. HL-2]|nr:ATPase, T2SS/T4P/T4SS family [Brucella sp. HL-2]MCV9909554.1 ATPase, T2SS/T4P/T4SS family [Brucella sp. HL-2]
MTVHSFMTGGGAGNLFTGPTRLYPGFAGFHAIEDLYELLCHAIHNDASDLIFQTGRPVLCEIFGSLNAITEQTLSNEVLARLFVWMTGQNNVIARLEGGRDLDASFEIPDRARVDEFGDIVRHRFRLNLTAGQFLGAATGYQAVMRAIPINPPTLEEVGFPMRLLPYATLPVGKVIISGPTGSGKTTTFAGLIRYVLENDTPIKGNYVTFEEPIEYDYGRIASRHSTIIQHEIHKHLPSFAAGIRGAMRRIPRLMVIGELRDPETMEAAVEAANTGNPIFTTVHANSVAHIFKRMVNKFPPDQQHQTYYNIVETTRLLMSQMLVPRKDGQGRVCVREWLVIDDEVREKLLNAGLDNHVGVVRSLLNEGGLHQSALHSTREFLDQGLIDEAGAKSVMRRFSISHSEVVRA